MTHSRDARMAFERVPLLLSSARFAAQSPFALLESSGTLPSAGVAVRNNLHRRAPWSYTYRPSDGNIRKQVTNPFIEVSWPSARFGHRRPKTPSVPWRRVRSGARWMHAAGAWLDRSGFLRSAGPKHTRSESCLGYRC